MACLLRSGSSNNAIYKIYGHHLATPFEFNHLLIKNHEAAEIDVYFSIVNTPPFADDWQNLKPTFVKTIKFNSGKKTGMVYRLDGYHVISISELADYYITFDQIYCHPKQIKDFALIESRLLTSILSFWLELTASNHVLHASCVDIKGKAVAFLAGSKSGKSTLAAAFHQKGYPLMTDDILNIRSIETGFYASAGYPAMHMWFESAKHFVGSETNRLPTISSQTSKLLVPVSSFSSTPFSSHDIKLDRIYLPIRSTAKTDNQVKIENVSAADSLFKLMSNCFLADGYRSLGKQLDKLTTISILAEKIPVKRIYYPDGFEHLSSVVSAIVADVDSGEV